MWHSRGSFNPGTLGSGHLDDGTGSIRFATLRPTTNIEPRSAVFRTRLSRILPAIFLAWSERARAVNRRFDVAAEPGRDILTTLRLWRPTNDLQYVDRN